MHIPGKKFWLIGLLGLTAVCSAPSALAGGQGYRYDGHGYSGHRYSGHRYSRYRYDRHRYDRQGYRHHKRHGYRHRHRSHSNRGAYLAGGIILGSVITHALTAPRGEYVDRSYTRSRVVRERSSEPDRRLFRDRNGNCYERSLDADGSELLLELPASECRW